MRVSEVMSRRVVRIDPEATVTEAALKMKLLDAGMLPVCQGSRLVGIITDRDITTRVAARGADPTSTRVREVMSADVVTCTDDCLVNNAAALMQDRQIRRLIVVDGEHHLVGVVSLGDLAVEGGDDELMGQTLEAISQPEHSP